MKKQQRIRPDHHDISIDEKTDDLIQEIIDAPSDDAEEMVRIAKIDPDLFAAFAKSIRKEDDPNVKSIIDAARRVTKKPSP